MFSVVPATFNDAGELDLPSQLRCIDFMIDAGSTGMCILSNFSEQFVLSDDEREVLTAATLKQVAGRVPVIVTTPHFGTKVCAERSCRAQDMDAAMVMVMVTLPITARRFASRKKRFTSFTPRFPTPSTSQS